MVVQELCVIPATTTTTTILKMTSGTSHNVGLCYVYVKVARFHFLKNNPVILFLMLMDVGFKGYWHMVMPVGNST